MQELINTIKALALSFADAVAKLAAAGITEVREVAALAILAGEGKIPADAAAPAVVRVPVAEVKRLDPAWGAELEAAGTTELELKVPGPSKLTEINAALNAAPENGSQEEEAEDAGAGDGTEAHASAAGAGSGDGAGAGAGAGAGGSGAGSPRVIEVTETRSEVRKFSTLPDAQAEIKRLTGELAQARKGARAELFAALRRPGKDGRTLSPAFCNTVARILDLRDQAKPITFSAQDARVHNDPAGAVLLLLSEMAQAGTLLVDTQDRTRRNGSGAPGAGDKPVHFGGLMRFAKPADLPDKLLENYAARFRCPVANLDRRDVFAHELADALVLKAKTAGTVLAFDQALADAKRQMLQAGV